MIGMTRSPVAICGSPNSCECKIGGQCYSVCICQQQMDFDNPTQRTRNAEALHQAIENNKGADAQIWAYFHTIRSEYP